MNTKQLLALAAILPLACATLPKGTQTSHTPVRVLSNNRSDVDVYLLCGDRDARWLGVVPERGAAAFEIPAAQTRCVSGLNFFLVVRDRNWGYWVGPLQGQAGSHIDLLIEKYAGLSTARLRSDPR